MGPARELPPSRKNAREALTTLAVRGLKETGRHSIPSFARIRKDTIKAKPERVRTIFGKTQTVPPKPEKVVFRITPCKKFTDRALEAQ